MILNSSWIRDIPGCVRHSNVSSKAIFSLPKGVGLTHAHLTSVITIYRQV